MNKKVALYLLLLTLIFQNICSAQINVFEKPPEKDVQTPGLSLKSTTRQLIDLNGKWDVSLDDGMTFSSFIIPMIMDTKSRIVFRKNFQLTNDMITAYNFVLVSEGLGYEAEIYLNNNFVTKNYFGYIPAIIQLDENSISASNEITIKTNNKLNFTTSLPTSVQTDIPKIYSGIQGDIYIVAVPKVYISNVMPVCKVESETTGRISSSITIASGNIEKYKNEGKNLSVRTLVYKGSGDVINESNYLKFNIDDYQTTTVKQDLTVKSPSLWSPGSPELYTVKIQIFNSDNLIDEILVETGFPNIKFSLAKKSFTDLKGAIAKLNGVNYSCDYPNFGTAVPYKLIEKDIRNIKEMGFNTVRVQGIPASPYLINICNRLGIYVLEEIPFNQISASRMKNPVLIKNSKEYLEGLIRRDIASPSVLAWGIGNDFDVTVSAAQSYIVQCRETASSLDSRPIYYTTNNLTTDICSELVDFKGVNIRNVPLEKLEKTFQEIKSLASTKTPAFISSYGVTINNDNKNGYNDKSSVDYQTKYLTEGFNLFSKTFFGNFITSFADWYEARPVNFGFSTSPYLNTSGLYDYNRNPKSSGLYLKKVLNYQSLQKLTEGSGISFFSDKSFIPIIIGLVFVLLFSFFYTKFPRFKEGVSKSYSMIFRSGSFYTYGKEQNIFSFFNTALMLIFAASGIALYVSGLFYFFKGNYYWNIFTANLFTNDSTKIKMDWYASNPVLSFVFIFILTIIHVLIVSVLISIVSLLIKQRVKYAKIFTVAVWALYPFILFLPVGAIIYKIAGLSSLYIILSLVIFSLFWVLYFIRIIGGFEYIFEYKIFRALIYGSIILVLALGSTFIYLYYYNSVFSSISLILSYK